MNTLEESNSPKKSNNGNGLDRLNMAADLLRDQKVKKSKQSKKTFDDLNLKDYKSIYASSKQTKKFAEIRRVIDAIEKVGPFKSKSIKLSKDFKVDYKGNLNKAQLSAVVTTEGPLLIIAGAGTGKTRVIVYRTGYLLEKGVDASRILLLTFTKKAANNMLEGVNKLLQNQVADEVAGGTFHSFASKMMRKYPAEFNVVPNFSIADVSDSEDTIALIREVLGVTKQPVLFPRKKTIYEIISKSRNLQLPIKEIVDRYYSGIDKIDQHVEKLEEIAERYTLFKEKSGTLDFDDLLEKFRDGLKAKTPFVDGIRAHYQYIMCDEFQDTNNVQKEIIDLLVNDERNVMFVGDDAQSIYTWRGANYENILRIPEEYPGCKIIKIEQNYRSSDSLIKFTNSIINSFVVGYKKTLFSDKNNHFKPTAAILYDQKKEAEYVVDQIHELRESNVELEKMAVLCRTGKNWKHIEMELSKRSIPYVTVGGIKLQEKSHVKDMTAYLKVMENPLNAIAWHRILKLIDGLGDVSATAIVDDILKNKSSFDITKFSKQNTAKGMKNLLKMLKDADSSTLSIPDKLELVKEYYKPILEAIHPDDSKNRLLDIDVLISFSEKYTDLEKLLTDFALEPPKKKFSSLIKGSKDESEEGRVVLSTVHSAKGLQWHTVFVSHANEGFFPSSKQLNDIEQLEEERRLFYVACTRAMEKLYITMPWYVEQYKGSISKPSRFLIEVDRETLELEENKDDLKQKKSQ